MVAEADRCDLLHALSCGSYLRSAGHAAFDGERRAHGAATYGRTEGSPTRSGWTARGGTGASVRDHLS